MPSTVININFKDNELFSAKLSSLLNVNESDHIILKAEISFPELKRHCTVLADSSISCWMYINMFCYWYLQDFNKTLNKWQQEFQAPVKHNCCDFSAVQHRVRL